MKEKLSVNGKKILDNKGTMVNKEEKLRVKKHQVRKRMASNKEKLWKKIICYEWKTKQNKFWEWDVKKTTKTVNENN